MQASCQQRAGRAGRVRPGHAFRLCTEEDFAACLPDASVPEMQRSELTGLLLQLKVRVLGGWGVKIAHVHEQHHLKVGWDVRPPRCSCAKCCWKPAFAGICSNPLSSGICSNLGSNPVPAPMIACCVCAPVALPAGAGYRQHHAL
jgi:hypothetical protein